MMDMRRDLMDMTRGMGRRKEKGERGRMEESDEGTIEDWSVGWGEE